MLNQENELLKIKLKNYKNMLLQLIEERDYYNEIAANAIEDLYDEKNKPKGLARILGKMNNS